MEARGRKRPRASLIAALRLEALKTCRHPTAIYFDDDASNDPHTQRAAALQLLQEYPEDAREMLAQLAGTTPPASSTPDPDDTALNGWIANFMPGAAKLALRRFDRVVERLL